MITDKVIEVTGEVIVHHDPDYTYLDTAHGHFLIAGRPNNTELINGVFLTGKARLWKACAWDGELIEWKEI